MTDLDLPRALEPWKATLAVFPVDLAASVGDVVARLSVLFGPLEREHVSPRGEPDGVAGIGRRGPFDRLLTTEWALLDEVPDEFLRRAAEQQLSFYEIARREPSADRRSVVLFDAGAGQLGGPRIVHLAALVLLAQRAADARARFAWGILQDPETTLYEAVSRSSVLVLVRARRSSTATAADRDRWAARLSALDKPSTARKKEERELWLVGGKATPDLGSAFAHRRVVVDDCLDPVHPDALDVAVMAARRPTRTARLEIPPSQTSVRLLRNPFAVEAPPRAIAANALGPGATPFVFSPNGRKLYTRAKQGALITLTIDRNDASSRVFAGPSGHVVIGAGQVQRQRRTVVLSKSAREIRVEVLGKRDRGSAWVSVLDDAAKSALDVADDAPLLRVFPVRRDASFVFHKRSLFCLKHTGGTGATARLVVPTLMAFQDGPSVVVVTAEESARLLRCTIDSQGLADATPIGEPPPFSHVERILVGPARSIGYPEGRGAFLLYRLTKLEARVVVPSDHEVIGVSFSGKEPCLVVIDEDRSALSLVTKDGVATKLFDVPGGLRYAQTSPYNLCVVVLGLRGGLEVRSTAAPSTQPIARFEMSSPRSGEEARKG